MFLFNLNERMRTDRPPKLALRFFRWFCHPKLLKYIEGDLMELYEETVKEKGKSKADLRFIVDVLLLCRPGIIGRGKESYTLNQRDMFKHYFTIGWRNLLRNKGYSLINIGGLAMGMTVAMLIGLWVYDEISFNTNHKNYNEIAHLRSFSTNPNTGESRNSEALQLPLVASVKNLYGHYFKQILIAFWTGDYTVSFGDKKIPEKGQFIEAGVTEMFSLKMIQGNYDAMKDPHSIILSQSAAKAFFGAEDPMNKSLKIDNQMDVTVTGVYEDLPLNSRFGEVQFFAPWELWKQSNPWIQEAEGSWDNSSFTAYVQLQPNVSMEAAQAGIKDFYLKNAPADWTEDVKKYKPELFLYPMSKWHLYSEFKNGLPTTGRITFVWLFGIVGAFVLLLACINFMNLSTARSEKRAKEVGVRKAIVSMKSLLIQQFISESFLVVLLSFFISMVFISLALPSFNELAAKDLSLPFLEPVFWMISVVFIVFTGLLASVYPAFYLSSFQPLKVLKGTFRAGRFSAIPRKVLVVIQFTVSIILVIGTIVVYQQIQHAQNRPVGYNREGIISIPRNDPNFIGKTDAIRNELLNTGVVEEMAMSSSPLTAVWNNNGGYSWQGKDPESPADFSATYVDHEFGKLVGWKFISGRDFSKDLRSDSTAIIINETAAKHLGFENPIGEIIKQEGNSYSWQVVGVIKDMIMGSPYEQEKRGFFFLGDNQDRNAARIHIRIKADASASEAIPKIEKVFKAIVPSAAFDYKFVDEQFARKFAQEERIGKLSSLFATLAIFISCLGLFGLASFVAEQRTKEIGVRKVLGASVFNLWKMLSRDFVILVMVSVFIAVPVASFFMNKWLLNYNYHTEISGWIFAIAGAGALLITLLTVSYQSIKASIANPVKSLRSE
jgi:putative ABC transport system permease protein